MCTRQETGLCDARFQRDTVSCRAPAAVQSKKTLLTDRRRRKEGGIGPAGEGAIGSGLDTFAI